MNVKKIYQFMRKNGGYVVGENAIGALRIARAAAMAEDIGLEVKWESEPGDWMDFAGDPEEEYRRKFENGEWRCCVAYVQDDAGNTLASLGGIVLTNHSNDYEQCVEYELLAEAWETIKRGEE